MRDKGWRTPRGAGEFLAPGSTRQKYPGWLHAPRQRCPQGTEGTKMDRAGLAHGAEPGQTLPAAPHTPSSCQRPCPTHPALLLLLLGVCVLAAADAGVAGDAVEAGDAVGGVLPLDAQLWGRREKPGSGERPGTERSNRARPSTTAPRELPPAHPAIPPFSRGPSRTPQRSEPPGKEDLGGTKPKISSQKHRRGKEPIP